MMPEREALKELGVLGLCALVGLTLGYTTMARYEARSTLSSMVQAGGPVPLTLDAHVRVDRVVNDMAKVMHQVENFYADRGRWPSHGQLAHPVPLSYPDLGELVRQYDISEQGDLRVTFSRGPLDGHSLVFTPRLGAHQVMGWSCNAPAALLEWVKPICEE